MAVAFHNATSAQGNPLTSQSFALPTISAGDIILLWVAWVPAGAVTISGAGTWTHQGTDGLISSQIQLSLWTAVSASGSESGQNVTINVAAQEKIAAVAASYSGVDNGTPLLSGPTYATSTASSTTSATAPSVSPSPASWTLEGFAEKSSTNVSYTTPAGETSRAQVFGSGGGAVDLALFDSNAAVSSGGGDTVTAGTTASNKIAVTVVLNTAITAVTLSDTGTGADTLTVAANVPLSNPAVGVESLAVTSAVTLPQSASVADTLTVAHALSDSGRGADGLTVTTAILLVDSSTGVDSSTIVIAAAPQFVAHGITLAWVVTSPTVLDGGNASSTMIAGYDGGTASSAMVDGIDGEFTIVRGGAGSGRTTAGVVNSGQTKSPVLAGGLTLGIPGESGKTGATSQ